MSTENIDYSAVLADLEAKRAALDAAISTLRVVLSGQGGDIPSSAPNGSNAALFQPIERAQKVGLEFGERAPIGAFTQPLQLRLALCFADLVDLDAVRVPLRFGHVLDLLARESGFLESSSCRKVLCLSLNLPHLSEIEIARTGLSAFCRAAVAGFAFH